MHIVFCTLLLHYIKNNQNLKITLQATFNHELNDLCNKYTRICGGRNPPKNSTLVRDYTVIKSAKF